MDVKTISAGVLKVAFHDYGPADGWPCIMGHGFPYDVHAYTRVAPILVEAGARVIVPYLRGYGPTRFLSSETPRSGEQAALGTDLLALMDALEIGRTVVGGYDWGGRAACVVSALWPERVVALVSGNSYNIQYIARAMEPVPPAEEAAYWYQYYFHSERGRRGLIKVAAPLPASSGRCGHRHGALTPQPSTGQPMLSTTPILSRSSSTRTGTVLAWHREIWRSRILNRASPVSHRSPPPPSPLTAMWTV